jgi:GT2 family glycosyltransferase
VSTAPPTTILVLSVDEASLLARSLPAAVAQPGAEVLVIDNACRDATRSVAQASGARVLELSERLPYAAAVNAGIVATEADALLLLNADCVLDAGFLAAARPRLAQPGVGSVAPRLVRATGMEPGDRLDVLDAAGMVVDRRRKNTLVGHNEPASRYALAAEVFGGDGACVLYRREVLDACAVGGEVLDEDLALWASDVDLAWRARLLGWRCMYEPRAVAWHMRFYSPTTRAGLPEAHRRLQFRNRLLMMAKNDAWADVRGDLHRIALYELLALGHVLRAYGEALRALPAALRRRAVVQANRRAGARPPFGLRAPR